MATVAVLALAVGAGGVNAVADEAQPHRTTLTLCAEVSGFEVEHLSALEPEGAPHWTPPVLDAAGAGQGYLFAWRAEAFAPAAAGSACGSPVAGVAARNVTQVGASVTLTRADRSGQSVTCLPNAAADPTVVCGAGAAFLHTPGVRVKATLELVLRGQTAAGQSEVDVTAVGWAITGLDAKGWGAAEWIGLAGANDTASQFRAAANLRAMGFARGEDVASAVLFASGLGGYRASVNGRAIDPTSIRASVTEWHNRTFYFADDVTSDVAAATAGNGTVVLAVELFKHWYALSNNFYPFPYGPRSLKAVLLLTHANGTTSWALPTEAGQGSSWRHASGSLLSDDLHAGQQADGRRATPLWESAGYRADPKVWAVATAVIGPPGLLRPHPMQHSRVVERVLPINVSAVPSTAPGTTYRFTLPYEIAGVCTLLLPRGCPAGTTVRIRHGECVDPVANTLCPVQSPSIGEPSDSYTCRGDTLGMSSHEVGWRRLAVGGNATGAADAPELEAFTPSFQYSAFKYVEVSVAGSGCATGFADGNCTTTGKIGSASNSVAVVESACLGKVSCVVPATVEEFAPVRNPCPHVVKSLAIEVHCTGGAPGFATCRHSCYDGTAPGPPPTPPTPPGPPSTPADRFNAVVAAARSTAIANYVMDIPTDSPQEEKRGWCGDSLAAHRTLAALFDTRAAWIKWTADAAYTSSVLEPTGTLSPIVPCIFWGACKNDPRFPNKTMDALTDLAWGSVLPQLAAFTAALSGDGRYAARIAGAAWRYSSLLHGFVNNASYEFPDLLNVTSAGDRYNVGQQGWPASSYGDWCPVNVRNGASGGCTSVSALLNSVYFILDVDAAASLLRTANASSGGGSGGGGGGGGPSMAQLESWVAVVRSSFSAAFRHNVTYVPSGPTGLQAPVVGLAFRDPHPPNVTHHGNPNVPPSAQAEAASGMAAMDAALTGSANATERAALAEMLAGLVLNVSNVSTALQVGGVVDMAQLGRSLVSFGRPDAAFALLSTDGQTSLFRMARSTGTLWAHPGGSDGDRGRCSSHNHIMQGGSVGEAVFGIGGIRPAFVRDQVPDGSVDEGRLILAPVPWLPDAPRGSAVWRMAAGVTATSWAASSGRASGPWSVWVNVSVPAGQGAAVIKVAVPPSARPEAVCVWECGFAAPTPRSFSSEHVAFGSSGGHQRATAAVPPASAAAPPDTSSSSCVAVWRSGQALPAHAVAGIASVTWAPAQPGTALYPRLTVATGSGAFAFFAKPC